MRRRQRQRARARRLPQLRTVVDDLGRRALGRRQQRQAIVEQRSIGGLRPAALGAGHGMRAAKARRVVQRALGRGHDVELGRADVGHEQRVRCRRRDLAAHVGRRAHRHRQHDQVGAMRCLERVTHGFVDEPARQRRVRVLASPIVTADALDRSCAPQRRHQRAADHAAADQRRSRKDHSTSRSAACKRAFSAAVPTVTRR